MARRWKEALHRAAQNIGDDRLGVVWDYTSKAGEVALGQNSVGGATSGLT